MKKSNLFVLVAVCMAGSVGHVHAALMEVFDDPITLSATQAPGTWYTDRYAPVGFESGILFDGDNRLRHSISSADGADNRPSGFQGAFYNTQGRKFDLDPGMLKLSIDLYIDSSWETTERRMAGLWGTAFNAAEAISFYPIIEFASDNADPRFQAWNGVDGWSPMGLPTGFAYDSWYTLEIQLAGGNFVYNVGDLSVSVGANGSANIGNVILQGYNTTEGVEYEIHWDNLAAVPEPTVLSYLGIFGAGLMAWRRRRNADLT